MKTQIIRLSILASITLILAIFVEFIKRKCSFNSEFCDYIFSFLAITWIFIWSTYCLLD